MRSSSVSRRAWSMVLATGIAAACDRHGTSPAQRALAPDTTALTVAVDGAPLFALVDEASVRDPAAQAMLAAMRRDPWSAVVRVARLVPGADTLLAVGRRVAIDVNARRRLVYVGVSRKVSSGGATSWEGTLDGGAIGSAGVTLTSAGVTGTVSVFPPVSALYGIRPIGGDYHAITYVDPSRVPVD